MKIFRGYVSAAQKGILSERPDAAEHERPVLTEELRPEKGDRSGGMPLPRLEPAAVQENAEPAILFPEAPARERSGESPGAALRALRKNLTGKVLAAAVLVNLLLLLLFAGLMRLDSPPEPLRVWFIQLTDRPSDAPAAGALPETLPKEETGHAREDGRSGGR